MRDFFLSVSTDGSLIVNWEFLDSNTFQKTDSSLLLTQGFLSPELSNKIYITERSNISHTKNLHSSKNELKYSTKSLTPCTQEIVDIFNSPRFLNYLESWFGFKHESLEADHSLVGGGIHCSFEGQFLKPHLDFTYSPSNCKKRVLNLLVYLNTEWTSQQGGVITFSRKVNLRKPYLPSIQSKVVPNCSQAIFRTDNGIWHGVSKVKSDYPRILWPFIIMRKEFGFNFQAILLVE